eukprot:g20375.t1
MGGALSCRRRGKSAVVGAAPDEQTEAAAVVGATLDEQAEDHAEDEQAEEEERAEKETRAGKENAPPAVASAEGLGTDYGKLISMLGAGQQPLAQTQNEPGDRVMNADLLARFRLYNHDPNAFLRDPGLALPPMANRGGFEAPAAGSSSRGGASAAAGLLADGQVLPEGFEPAVANRRAFVFKDPLEARDWDQTNEKWVADMKELLTKPKVPVKNWAKGNQEELQYPIWNALGAICKKRNWSKAKFEEIVNRREWEGCAYVKPMKDLDSDSDDEAWKRRG